MVIRLARLFFRMVPLSAAQKLALMSVVFDLTGERFKFLPSYQLYLRNRKWLKAPVPKDLVAARQRVLSSVFHAEFQTAQGAAALAVGVAGGGISPLPKNLLMITHSLGGGTQQHVDDMTALLEVEGVRVFHLHRHNAQHLRLGYTLTPLPSGETPSPARLSSATSPDGRGVAAEPGEPLFFRWPEEINVLAETLKMLGVGHFHLHHTVDMPEDFLVQLPVLAAATGAEYDFTAHDYFPICPRFTLFDEGVRGYCGEPQDARKCTACVNRYGSAAGKDVNVAQWRQNYGTMLAAARRVFVPDEDVKTRLQRYFPALRIDALPHPEAPFCENLAAAPRGAGETLRVAIIGGIAPHKGSKVLYDCAEDALKRGLPIHFTLVGYSDIDHKLKALKNVTVTGHFQPEELPEKLRAGKFHLAFAPGVWPETYNYVLSECWRHGLFVVCLDIGAIARRIKAATDKRGAVLPYEWHLHPAKINDALLAQEIAPLPPVSFPGYASVLREYYGFSASA